MNAQLVIKDFTKPGFLSADGYVIFQYGGSWKKAVERARSRGPHALDQVHHGYYPFFELTRLDGSKQGFVKQDLR